MDFIDVILQTNSSKVMPSEIGIVSPYKLQCKKIRNACEAKGLDSITVGTSEVFQGQERKVIIVSTVQSSGKYLGSFVSDPQVSNKVIQLGCLFENWVTQLWLGIDLFSIQSTLDRSDRLKR